MSKIAPPPSSNQTDRLVLVEVQGLFGVFKHTIPLRSNSNITVIHGPNGVGKTILLRMIREVFSGRPDVLPRIPFTQLELFFESGDRLKLTQESDRERNKKYRINYEAIVNGTPKSGKDIHNYNLNVIQMITESMGTSWDFIDDEQGNIYWRDKRDGETLDLQQVKSRSQLPSSVFDELTHSSQTIDAIRAKCNVRFIGTDRLFSDTRNSKGNFPYPNDFAAYLRRAPFSPTQIETDERSIAVYSANLKERIGDVISNYGKLTERLDRTLVKRLLQRQYEPQNSEQVLNRFRELDEKRQQLINLGLLTETEDVIGISDESAVLSLVSQNLELFSLYIHDMENKLALFDDLREKVQILVDRTNQRFQFKKFTITPNEGFLFISDSGAKLRASDLSSGEQHEMILFYELLFSTNEGDLVLIDEPEISLHVEWQLEFLNDLRAAIRSSHTYVLLATHAPAIAQGAGDNVVPLGPYSR